VRVRIDGKQRERTFPTKTLAAEWLTKQEADRLRGTSIDPQHERITVEELAKSWFASNPGKRPNSTATDVVAVDRHIVPFLGARKIGSLRAADVQRLVNNWASSLKPRTVGRYYGVLRAMLEYAVVNDWIGRTPCRGIKLPKPTRIKGAFLTPKAVEKIAAAMPDEYRAMVWIGAVLGLRWEEVAALRVSSFDLKRGTLTVSETVIRDGKGRSLLGAPKSEASSRTLSVPPPLTTVIREHFTRQRLRKPDDLLFVDSGGGLLRYSNWRNRAWVPAAAKAGHPKAGFHSLRRAHATSLVVSGVDPRTAKDRLGHSDVRLTLELYAQSVPEADRRAGEVSGAYFMPSRKQVRGKRGEAKTPSS
ncbi:MAG: tyrosine-type recombinase/integrase, partial [Acidimicrobiales bacterium]